MKKYFFLLFLSCLFSQQIIYGAAASRSDSIDIRKTIIHFDITDFVTKNISGYANLLIKSKVNGLNEILLDLEGLTVDSIQSSNSNLTFTHSNQTLVINPTSALNNGDSLWIDIYYHGVPIADATWGGFNFVGNYGFQIGVGFTAQPHSFGRTWHPCLDNMVERSPYEFFITTTNDKMAVCNGLLLDSTSNPNNTKTWHWNLLEEIPSYLSSVAVANYVLVKKNLIGNNGNIDALIACEAIDSNKVHGSFSHLQESFTMMENNFGTYRWPRVGYALAPFNGGAMEHATNIAIGKVFIDGTLNYETLIAHELSHHWFGDLITCSTVQDMWLNEGFASYCEYLHQEYTYGLDAYNTLMRDNHFDVLSAAHIKDDGYKSVANMDSLHTYGTTVYIKGADVIHTLRSYMGDSLFFNGLTAFLNANKYKAVNTFELRDFLSTFSGINLTPYFNNWVLSPGFTDFTIDSTHTNGNEVSVFVRQRKHKSTDYYSEVPLQIGFYDNQWQKHLYTLPFSGRCMELKVQLPFTPIMIILDPDEKLSDATTEDEKVIKFTGNSNFNYAKCRLTVKSLNNNADSSYIRVAHHWVAPDRFKNQTIANGYVLNDVRYWQVDGINLNNINGLLHFPYSGLSGNNYLDSSWIKNTEDSIHLFYRQNASYEWQIANDSLAVGNVSDKLGTIYGKEIKAGEYCLGIKRSNYIDPLQTDAPSGGCNTVLNITSKASNQEDILLFPNPTQGKLNIHFTSTSNQYPIEYVITDAVGKMMKSGKLVKGKEEIDLAKFPKGFYIFRTAQTSKKIIVE